MQQNTLEQQKAGRYRRVSGSGYVLAAVMVSGVLHAAAAAWWLHRPPQILEMSGVQEVTVSLISLEPPAPEPVAETPPQPPEPELLRDDEMAEKRKIVKKKPPEKKPQPKPEPVQEQPITPTAAEPKPAPAPVAAARYDVDYLNNATPSYPPLSRR